MNAIATVITGESTFDLPAGVDPMAAAAKEANNVRAKARRKSLEAAGINVGAPTPTATTYKFGSSGQIVEKITAQSAMFM